jgi:CHAD domain-containing protein
MNSSSLSSDGKPRGEEPPSGKLDAAAQAGFGLQVEAWRQSLELCGQKPSRKRVHSLRVATLRLQAGLEHWLRTQEPGPPDARAVKRWSEQGKKLRRALRPVREADVYLSKLASLHNPSAVPEEGQLPLSPRCLRQIGKLEQRLAQKRQTAEKKLIARLEDRRERLGRLSQEMEAALAPPAPFRWGCSASEISGLVAGLAGEFSSLDSGNLHAFRKRIKKVRYLAGISAVPLPTTGRQAVLKRIQAAAGEWHDWHVLAEEAGRVFRGRKAGGLVQLLETLASKSLEEALGVCRHSMAHLLKRRAKNGPYGFGK